MALQIIPGKPRGDASLEETQIQGLPLGRQHTGQRTKGEIQPMARRVNRFYPKVNSNALVELLEILC